MLKPNTMWIHKSGHPMMVVLVDADGVTAISTIKNTLAGIGQAWLSPAEDFLKQFVLAPPTQQPKFGGNAS